jgi:hypothetical protein
MSTNMHVTEFGIIEILMEFVRLLLLRATNLSSNDLSSWGSVASFVVSALIATLIFQTIKRLVVSKLGWGRSSSARPTNTMSSREYGSISVLMKLVRTVFFRAAGWNPKELSSSVSVASYFVAAAVAVGIQQAFVRLLAWRKRDGVQDSQATPLVEDMEVETK